MPDRLMIKKVVWYRGTCRMAAVQPGDRLGRSMILRPEPTVLKSMSSWNTTLIGQEGAKPWPQRSMILYRSAKASLSLCIVLPRLLAQLGSGLDIPDVRLCSDHVNMRMWSQALRTDCRERWNTSLVSVSSCKMCCRTPCAQRNANGIAPLMSSEA